MAKLPAMDYEAEANRIAARLRELIEQEPVYVIDGSPVFESPLSIFNTDELKDRLEADFKIPRTAVRTIPSPWLIKRLEEIGSASKLKVRKLYPSQLRQQCSARVEPGDENNQDVSTMVGKLNIRMIEKYEQDHPYAYSYSGGLCLANQGLLEFVEMFKAPIKVLHPLLTATQEGNYKGTEGFGAIPFDGIVLAHSNESEWKAFRNNRNNEAFLDRISPDISCESRMRITFSLDGHLLGTALNEAVIVTSRPAKMLRFSISIDGNPSDQFRADGMIVATPTGSTAYAMSAGGPLVDPRVEGFLLVPLAPYMLSSRPHLISSHRDVELALESPKPAHMVLDGQVQFEIDGEARIRVERAVEPALFVNTGRNFFGKVEQKLRRL